MHFNKLFSTLTTSTIWGESNETRIVWITMLAMADINGKIHSTIPGLARHAVVTTEQCRCALTILMSPDPDSRTKDYEGRRIVEIDGGWQLLNHAKYRLMLSQQTKRENQRTWVAEKRAKVKADAERKALQEAADGPPLPTDEVEEFSDKD